MLGPDKQSLPQKKEGQLRTVVPHTLFFSKILATPSIVFLSLSFGNQASIRVVGYQTPAQESQQYSPIAFSRRLHLCQDRRLYYQTPSQTASSLKLQKNYLGNGK